MYSVLCSGDWANHAGPSSSVLEVVARKLIMKGPGPARRGGDGGGKATFGAT